MTHALLIKNLNLASCNAINNTLYIVCDSLAWDNTDNNKKKIAGLNLFYNPNKSSSKLKKCLDARLDTVFSICVFFSRSHALFTGPTNTLFSKKNIKTESNDTIHIFKNYFVIVFLVFSNK